MLYLNIVLFSLKVIVLFYLKHKAVLDPVHVATSEMKISVTQAILATGSILDVGMGPGYTLDSYYFIFQKPSGKKIFKAIKINEIYF